MSDTRTNSVRQGMEEKLKAHFSPTELHIIDESGKHQGHSHHKGGVAVETGETHFRIILTSSCFTGMKLQERHRAVYRALADELRGPVHALALTVKAPQE